MAQDNSSKLDHIDIISEEEWQFPRVLTACEMLEVEFCLARKWGIQMPFRAHFFSVICWLRQTFDIGRAVSNRIILLIVLISIAASLLYVVHPIALTRGLAAWAICLAVILIAVRCGALRRFMEEADDGKDALD